MNLSLGHWLRILFINMKSILLIEHESSLRTVLQVYLTEIGGWRVTLSNSIQDAIDLCVSNTPDAILLDTSTPETDVLLFVEQLKDQSVRSAIPIILLTARASWFTARQLNAMGFAGAIAKPFDPTALTRQISQLLGWGQDES